MKNLIALAILFSSFSASAITMKINQLSCSGLGNVTGYTTISLTEPNKLSMTSVKYFVTTSDKNVSIVNSRIISSGRVQLDLYSSKFNSNFSLVLSGPVGPASLNTDGGTDILNCQSNITANN